MMLKELRNAVSLHACSGAFDIEIPDAHVSDFDLSSCIILFFQLPHRAAATLPRLHDQVFRPFQASKLQPHFGWSVSGLSCLSLVSK